MAEEGTFWFYKSEDFFALEGWQHVKDIVDYKFLEDQRTLVMTVTLSDPQLDRATVLLQVPRHDVLRLRFSPEKRDWSDYPRQTLRSQADSVARAHAESHPGGVTFEAAGDHLAIRTYAGDSKQLLVRIVTQPFGMQVWRVRDDGVVIPVIDDDGCPLRFRSDGQAQLGYSVMAVKNKPTSAWYTGFGEQGGTSLFKTASQHNFFNYDNFGGQKVYNHGPEEGREPLYHSATFFLELNGVPGRRVACGVFVDNPGQSFFDLGVVDPDQVRVATRSGDLDYYLFVGDTPQHVLHRYSQLVDHAALKPRWALGYHQGCYGYVDRGAVEYVAGNYRDPRLGTPIDGLHLDVDFQHAYETFTTDDDRFPDAKGMLADLRAKGFKCSTNITPIISNDLDHQGHPDPRYGAYASGLAESVFVAENRAGGENPDEQYQWYDGGVIHRAAAGQVDPSKPYVGEVSYGDSRGTTGHYPDFGRPEVSAWWGRQYQDLFDKGLEMVWQDMTTPAIRDSRGDMLGFPFRLNVTDNFDPENRRLVPALAVWNLYSYNLHRATYQGLNALAGRENRRNFVIGRGSTSGTARYAALWTGDNTSTWDFLKVATQQMLALGVSGQPMAGADVGGFGNAFGEQWWADPTLMIRWTAAGAFFPWFRNHYVGRARGSKQFQEPWGYQQLLDDGKCPPGQEGLYGSVLPICRYYIGLRYRMLQVFYDAMFSNIRSGQPICRILSLVHPDDQSLFAENLDYQSNEFMVGDDILVAPVLDPENICEGRRDVYLPTGTDWYRFTDPRQLLDDHQPRQDPQLFAARRPLEAPQPGGTTIRGVDARIGDDLGEAPLVDPEHVPSIVPMYVRAGAVVPMLELEQYVGERHERSLDHPLTYTIYAGEAGTYTAYLDDGTSRSSAPKADSSLAEDPAGNDEYRQVTIAHRVDRTRRHRYVDVERDHDGWSPREQYFYVQLLHDPSEKCGDHGPLESVSCGGTTLPMITDGDLASRARNLQQSAVNAWYHDETINASFVKVFDASPSLHLVATYLV